MGRFPTSDKRPAATGTSQAAWEKSCFSFTIGHEGGLSTDRNDPGNWTGNKVNNGRFVGTKYGISAGAHPTLDIKSLTLAQAEAIYWRDYVVAQGFDRLPLPLLLVVFEASVNDGQAEAARLLPDALKRRTIQDQITSFCAANLAYHKRLSNWPRYGKGWAARIAAGQKQALLLAAAAPVALPPQAVSPVHEPASPVPKPRTQPEASRWTLFWRSILSGLFGPVAQGA